MYLAAVAVFRPGMSKLRQGRFRHYLRGTAHFYTLPCDRRSRMASISSVQAS